MRKKEKELEDRISKLEEALEKQKEKLCAQNRNNKILENLKENWCDNNIIISLWDNEVTGRRKNITFEQYELAFSGSEKISAEKLSWILIFIVENQGYTVSILEGGRLEVPYELDDYLAVIKKEDSNG